MAHYHRMMPLYKLASKIVTYDGLRWPAVAVLTLCIVSGCSGCPQSSVAPSAESAPPSRDPTDTGSTSPEVSSAGTTKSSAAASTESSSAPSASSSSQPTEAAHRAAETPDQDASAGATALKPSSGSPGLTADEAYNRADGSYQTARQLAASQDFGAAFREASKAWEHVRHFSQDDRCRELARQLQADLRRWGARANHRYQTLLDSDPRLIEQ